MLSTVADLGVACVLIASVSDWRLVCVHFHNGVVHAHCRERSQYMLDCMDPHRAFADRR